METTGRREIKVGRTTVKVKYGWAPYPVDGSFYLAPHVIMETVKTKRKLDKRKHN